MMAGSKCRHLNKGGLGLHTKASYQGRASPLPDLQHFLQRSELERVGVEPAVYAAIRTGEVTIGNAIRPLRGSRIQPRHAAQSRDIKRAAGLNGRDRADLPSAGHLLRPTVSAERQIVDCARDPDILAMRGRKTSLGEVAIVLRLRASS